MYMFIFEWDDKKEKLNQKKHQVSFIEAQSVFLDYFAQVIPDPDHSVDEDRFIIIGASSSDRLLLVVHCYKVYGKHVRIISARKPTTREAKQYKEKR